MSDNCFGRGQTPKQTLRQRMRAERLNASHGRVDLRGELLCKDEVGRRAGDGDDATDGGGIGDAERQAFADHVILPGGILGVAPLFLLLRDVDRGLRESEEEAVSGKGCELEVAGWWGHRPLTRPPLCSWLEADVHWWGQSVPG